MHFHAADLGDFAVFLDRPEFLEDFVELLFVGHGEDFLIGDLAVMQFDSAISQTGHGGIVRDHHDGASLLMKFAQQAQDDLFVHCVQVSSGLVGQDDFGIVDQCAGDANSLLLASRKLRGQVPGRDL